MRPDVIEVFCGEMPKRVCVVTNGTFPLKSFENLSFYWVSLMAQNKCMTAFEERTCKTRKNILDYIEGSDRHGKPAWKDIWISTTINALNYTIVEDLVEEWRGKVNKIAFQFHTPFIKGDPLWLAYGEKRSDVIDKIIKLHRKYPDFVINDDRQLSLMKGA